MLNLSKILLVNEQSPKGFGDAVRYAETFVGKSHF